MVRCMYKRLGFNNFAFKTAKGSECTPSKASERRYKKLYGSTGSTKHKMYVKNLQKNRRAAFEESGFVNKGGCVHGPRRPNGRCPPSEAAKARAKAKAKLKTKGVQKSATTLQRVGRGFLARRQAGRERAQNRWTRTG